MRKQLKNYSRLILAFSLAPAVPAILMYIYGALLGSDAYFSDLIYLMLGVAYLFAALLGIPAYLFLKYKNWVNLKHFLFTGGIIGFVVFALFVGVMSGMYSYGVAHFLEKINNTYPFLILCVFSGIISGGIFGIIVSMKQND